MEQKSYQNPAGFSDGRRHTNPDPYVLKWCGTYYCYATDAAGVKVSVSEDLVSWEDRGYAIREEEFHDYWAPAVIYLNGSFYMYYSNVPEGEEDCHEECLKLAVSRNPEGPFQWKKTFFDKFSIDAHPILWKGRLYLFYSVNDWMGTEESVAGTCILADEMKSPWELAGNPKPAVLPGIPQEIYAKNRFGDGRDWYTIEGAAPVVRGNRFWLLYSANAYVNVDYYIGTAVAQCREALLDMVWKKFPNDYTWHPLLSRNEAVEGTGHNTVVKAPNMADEWIVYHGRNAAEELDPEREQREMRIDPLYFNGDELLCFGPTSGPQEAPAMPEIRLRNLKVLERKKLGESSPYYVTELWISAKPSHCGARYSILGEYQDENNYLEIEILTGRQQISAISCVRGIRTVIGRERIGGAGKALDGEERPFGYDETVPHLLRVTRVFEHYTAVLDDKFEMHFTYVSGRESGSVEILPYFTEVTVHSFDLTRTVMLTGKELQHLGGFYEVSSCTAEDGGLAASGPELVLRRIGYAGAKETALSGHNGIQDGSGSPKKGEAAASGRNTIQKRTGRPDGYTEIFSLDIMNGQNQIELLSGETSRILAQGKKTEFSLYHIVRGEREWFLADGERMEGEPVKNGAEAGAPDSASDDVPGLSDGFLFRGLKITEYQYTEIGSSDYRPV